jgi:hypothetical protein
LYKFIFFFSVYKKSVKTPGDKVVLIHVPQMYSMEDASKCYSYSFEILQRWHAWRNAIFLCRMFFCIRNIYLRNTQIIVILMSFIFFWGYYGLVQPLATTFMISVQELSENEWISSDRLIYIMVKLIVIIPLRIFR